MSNNKNLVPFTQAEEKVINKLIEQRDKTQAKFHLVYALAATFGFVSVLYGFEKMIDKVNFFVEKPWVLLIVGLIILAITGSLYKKLD